MYPFLSVTFFRRKACFCSVFPSCFLFKKSVTWKGFLFLIRQVFVKFFFRGGSVWNLVYLPINHTIYKSMCGHMVYILESNLHKEISIAYSTVISIGQMDLSVKRREGRILLSYTDLWRRHLPENIAFLWVSTVLGLSWFFTGNKLTFLRTYNLWIECDRLSFFLCVYVCNVKVSPREKFAVWSSSPTFVMISLHLKIWWLGRFCGSQSCLWNYPAF